MPFKNDSPPPLFVPGHGQSSHEHGTQMLFAFRCSEPLVEKKRDPWKMIPNLFLKCSRMPFFKEGLLDYNGAQRGAVYYFLIKNHILSD